MTVRIMKQAGVVRAAEAVAIILKEEINIPAAQNMNPEEAAQAIAAVINTTRITTREARAADMMKTVIMILRTVAVVNAATAANMVNMMMTCRMSIQAVSRVAVSAVRKRIMKKKVILLKTAEKMKAMMKTMTDNEEGSGRQDW